MELNIGQADSLLDTVSKQNNKGADLMGRWSINHQEFSLTHFLEHSTSIGCGMFLFILSFCIGGFILKISSIVFWGLIIFSLCIFLIYICTKKSVCISKNHIQVFIKILFLKVYKKSYSNISSTDLCLKQYWSNSDHVVYVVRIKGACRGLLPGGAVQPEANCKLKIYQMALDGCPLKEIEKQISLNNGKIV